MKFGRPRDLPKEKYNPEVKEIIDNLNQYNTFDSLPLVHTGCDTYASIYPEFKNFMMNHTVDELVEKLRELLPEGKWTQANGQDVHFIITGGEPLLGWQTYYVELFNHPFMQDLKNVTFETNATQRIHPEFKQFLESQEHLTITWSCSPKLSVSGEDWSDAIRPEIVKSYQDLQVKQNLYLKFVVNDDVDVEEVDRAVAEYRAAGVDCPVYLMPVGGRTEEYATTQRRVAELAMQKGYRFSPRLHVIIFGNQWGT
jgi:organic radical activating enzyme